MPCPRCYSFSFRATGGHSLVQEGKEPVMRNHGLLLAVLLVFCACVAVAANHGSSAAADAKTSFTLPFDLVDNRVFIEARLNGRGPFHFLLDTSAGGITISTNVAQQLGLHVADAGDGQGVGEKTVHAGEAQIAQLQVGDLALADVDSHVMDLSDAPQVFGTKPFDGIIGLPIFERMVVKHSYGAGQVRLRRRRRDRPFRQAAPDSRGRGRARWRRGKFRRGHGRALVAIALRVFLLAEQSSAKVWREAGRRHRLGHRRPVRSLLARAQELQIGDVVVRDLVIRLSAQKTGLTTSSAMAGLIDPDVLSQFDVTFDYARTRIIFERNKNNGRRDSYERAGIWMGQDKDGKHFTVVDVIAGGPGAAAGVKPGDQILAIDGKNTASLILPDVREPIRREGVGDKLTLLLESEGKQRTAVITLKDVV